MPMKELCLIYSDHIRSAFEVYELDCKKLLGHITFTLEDDKPSAFYYTPFGLKKGKSHTSIIGALRDHFQSEIHLHFPISKK
jgi:hypothetical protein